MQPRSSTPTGYEADYKSIEVGAHKRFTNKWSLVGSFSRPGPRSSARATSAAGNGGNYGPREPDAVRRLRQPAGFPDHAQRPHRASEFSAWNFKAHGTYEPGWGLRLTPIFRIQQGYPYGRVLRGHRHRAWQRSNFGRAEPITTNRMDTIKQLDIRAEKKLSLAGRLKLGLIFDVYNVFNANTELNLRATTGRLVISESGENIPTFGTPVTILPPRIARFSVRLEF